MAENIKPALGDPKAATPPAAPKAKSAASTGVWPAIQDIKANGRTFAEATQIESSGAWTIANVTALDRTQAVDDKPFCDVQQGVILPIGAEPGDLVELYFTGYTGRVFTPEGDSFQYADADASIDVGSSALFRKVTEKGWRYVAGA